MATSQTFSALVGLAVMLATMAAMITPTTAIMPKILSAFFILLLYSLFR